VVEGTRLRLYGGDGAVRRTFGSAPSPLLGVVRAGAGGPILVGQHAAGTIHKYDPDGTDRGVVLAGYGDWQPTGLAWNDGRLYAASYRYNGVASYALDAAGEDGSTSTPDPQRGATLPHGGSGLCSAGDRGGVYVTTHDDATGAGMLGHWDGRQEGAVRSLATFPAGSRPRGVAVVGDAWYVALAGPGKVVKVAADGAVADWLTGLATPVGLGVHGDDLYVATHGDRAIRAYRLRDASVRATIATRDGPQYLALLGPGEAGRAGDHARLEAPTRPGGPVAEVHADLAAAGLSHLSWDTEGGDRARLNLLLDPATLAGRIGGRTVPLTGTGRRVGPDRAEFALVGPGDIRLTWAVELADGAIRMSWTGAGADLATLEGLELRLPFDPRATATGPVTGEVDAEGRFRLPLLLNAPDLGAMQVTATGRPGVACRWEGSRGRIGCWATLTVELPPVPAGETLQLRFDPLVLPQPDGLRDAERWAAARRGWMNLLQASASRPAEAHYKPCPAGIWANNIISDPVSATQFWLADHVLLVPDLAPGLSARPLLRRSVELFLDRGLLPDGGVRYVWDDGFTMDASPALLIAAWAYVESGDDAQWLGRYRAKLDAVAGFLERRDVDGDGLVESPQSGNRDTRTFGDTAWDCIASGHENAYVNALTYRAWLGMARLEARGGRPERAAHYAGLAERLKGSYRATFFNPETGWLAWWKSADGELHDLWSDTPTSVAVMYGLLAPEDGGAMLDRHWKALQASGFRAFEVGLPLTVRPIPPALMLQGYGGAAADGSDTFGKYLNGGACVSNTSFWLAASYIAGRRERADAVLDAMLARQRDGVFPNGGGFQNGVIDRYPDGAEFFDWAGRTCGYEGHLVYSWTWLHALFVREGAYEARVLGRLR
jgi:hypothetical protein